MKKVKKYALILVFMNLKIIQMLGIRKNFQNLLNLYTPFTIKDIL